MFQKESVYKVGYREIENLINEHLKTDKHREVEQAKRYGRNDYELPCYEEMGNDVSMDVCVEKGKVDDYDKKTVDRAFAEGKWPHYSTSVLMNMLCDLDVIPEGEYIISISW